MKKNWIRISLLSSLLFICIYAWLYSPHIAAPTIIFIILNIWPSPIKRPKLSLRIASDGADILCAFLVIICIETITFPLLAVFRTGWFTKPFWIHFLIIFIAEFILFWNGIIRIYTTSSIVGLKWRVVGILCGFIPIANIVVLVKIIRLVRTDVQIEETRAQRNAKRSSEQVCKTKYPILLIHGVFFRDLRYFNYWGRIPKELEKNGATLFYGNQQSALNIPDSAAEIAKTIQEIIKQTNCEKVNIIAHSKGGLDCRYAITHLGMDKYVSSLTTVNTPHRGCAFADWLLDKASESFKNTTANAYNAALRKLGDPSPDFLAAVNELKASSCKTFNSNTPDCANVYYQSTASKINRLVSNVFPLCFTHSFVKMFDGENDGLVSVQSAKWGQNFIYLHTDSPAGISHADMIDLARHNRADFDICEFYVNLVSQLKNMGM